MRLDHLLSRETLSCPDAVERSSRDLEEKGRLGPVHEERPQHPAPRAPGRLSGACPGHLDICIARDIDGIITSGPEKARAIARSESFRYAIPIETRNGPAPARGRLWEEKIHKAHGGCCLLYTSIDGEALPAKSYNVDPARIAGAVLQVEMCIRDR